MVKAWHSFQRMMGKSVDLVDIWTEFYSVVKQEVAILQLMADHGQLQAKSLVWKENMEKILQVLGDNLKYRDVYVQKICLRGNLTIGRPSRYTDLTPEQEEINWQITWQGFDHAVWLEGFGEIRWRWEEESLQ